MVDFLKLELGRRSKANAGYSIRAFARDLEMSSSALSAVLRKRRPITPKAAGKILDRLAVSPAKKRLLLLSVAGPTLQASKTDRSFEVLEEKAFEVVSSWEHFAILSLLEIKGVKFTGAVIARRLNLPMGVVLEALSRLQALGLAHETSHGWRATGKQLSTSQDVPSASLRAVHRQYIDRATYSLEHHPVEERDITGITMAIDKEKLGEAKRMIKAFRRELSDFLETGTQSEVYRLNVQLFPLKK